MADDGGELMIYGVIGDEWDGLSAKQIIANVKALGEVETITLRINSVGGYVHEGLAIFNALREHPARKVVTIDGLAASMASVIAMVGDEIVMPAGSLMMIHNPWNIAIGDAAELRKQADVLDKWRDSIVGIYASRTGQEPEALQAMLDAETWMSGEEAVAAGFATRTEGEIAAAAMARHDVSVLNLKHKDKVPAPLRRAVSSRLAAAGLNRAAVPADHAKGDGLMSADNQTSAVNEPAEKKDVVNVDAVRAEAVAAERTRMAEIRRAVRAAKLDDGFADALIDGGVSVAEAHKRIIEKWADQDTPVETRNAVRVEVVADGVDRFRAGATAALVARAGMGKDDAGNEFRGLSLRELARECLEIHNVSTRGLRPMDMVKAAFTHSTSDFTHILADVANKSMLRGYEEAEETFPRWTATGSLPDFKPGKRIDLNAFPSLSEVPEGAEYIYGTIGDRGETIQLATYGKMFSITRQAIINDDMSVFTRVPQRMGRAAARTVGNLVYAILTGNPAMSDGVTLFHSSHGNLAGSGGAISVTTIDAARVAMATQKDRSGNATLNIRPRYLIVPVALEGTARVHVESEFDPSKTQRVPNSVRGIADVVSDARLDAASATAWYMAADPNATDTIEVAYLDGVQTPVLEQQDGWKVDGVEFKVRIDAGVKALAWEGLYKNAGA